MKMIAAVVQPHRLDEIREALNSIGIHGMTASEVQGYGRQGGHKEIYRGAEYDIHFVPKIKIEIVVSDDQSRYLQVVQHRQILPLQIPPQVMYL